MKSIVWAKTVFCGSLLFSIGCRSISSTFVQRMDNDNLVGNSNGERGHHCNAKPFKGVPVTMQVLTHVDITISEELFLDKKTLQPVHTNRRNLGASQTPIYSDKIFAVDPKRAASGTSKYTLDMNSEGSEEDKQYFKQIKQNVDDTTIKDVNAVLTNLLPKLIKPASTQKLLDGTINPTNDFIKVTRHVAWKRFDIGAPDFQDQIRLFVEHHMNNCNECCGNGSCVTPLEYAQTDTSSVHADAGSKIN